VLARIGTGEDGTRCAGVGASHSSARGLRLYYDSTSRKSRFDATFTPISAGDLFLHSDGRSCPPGGGPSAGVTKLLLDDMAPASESAKCRDSGAVNFGGGNPFRMIGTWSLTAP
jgi:hypothetical protein